MEVILARKRLESQSYDTVLMKVQMPEMDGFETAKAIRERIEAGMDDYVSKPVSMKLLDSAN